MSQKICQNICLEMSWNAMVGITRSKVFFAPEMMGFRSFTMWSCSAPCFLTTVTMLDYHTTTNILHLSFRKPRPSRWQDPGLVPAYTRPCPGCDHGTLEKIRSFWLPFWRIYLSNWLKVIIHFSKIHPYQADNSDILRSRSEVDMVAPDSLKILELR